jgi:hypothetical protein
MRSTLTAACTVLVLTAVPSAEADEWHICHFDDDEKVLAYALPKGDEDVVRATCANAAMLHMEWRYQGARGPYPRGVLALHGPSQTLALEGPIQTEPHGRQTLTVSINTNSAVVRLIRRSDVEVRHPGGRYLMRADKTGCIEALLTACIFSRPAARITRVEPD